MKRSGMLDCAGRPDEPLVATDHHKTWLPLEWLSHPAAKAVLVAVLIGSFGYVLARSWTDLSAVRWQFEPLPAVAAFLMIMAANVGAVLAWLAIVRGLGGALAIRPALRIYLVSGLAKYLPGKVLHAVGRVAMLQYQSVSPRISVTSVLLEVALTLLAASLVSLSSVPLLAAHGASYLVPPMLLAVPAGLIVLYPPVLSRLLRRAARFVPGVGGALCGELLPYSTILKVFAAYLALWTAQSAALYVTALAVYPLDLAWLPALAGIVAVSYVFGLAVPIAPSGLGARDGLTTLLLAGIMPLPAAAATSLLYRVLGLAAEAAAAAVASRL